MHKLVLIKLGHVTTKDEWFGSFKDPHIMDHIGYCMLLLFSPFTLFIQH